MLPDGVTTSNCWNASQSPQKRKPEAGEPQDVDFCISLALLMLCTDILSIELQ